MLAVKPDINSQLLLSRVEKTSEKLRALLEAPDLDLRLALTPDAQIERDYITQWTGNTEGFHWGTYLNTLEGVTSKFIIAAYHGDTLTGLCQYNVSAKQPKRLNIQAIEGKQKENPLKGYTTPIFNELSLSIARDFGYPRIGVVWPESNTVSRHTRVLDYISLDKDLMASVSDNTTVNWDAQFEHQKAKGLYVPKHAR